jgi:hypothetical protein
MSKSGFKVILLAFEVLQKSGFQRFFSPVAAPVSNFRQFGMNILVDNVLFYSHKNF